MILLITKFKVKHQGSKKCNNEAYVIATAVVILVAGYDTTANTMGFMYYMLALNPDIQARLPDGKI